MSGVIVVGSPCSLLARIAASLYTLVVPWDWILACCSYSFGDCVFGTFPSYAGSVGGIIFWLDGVAP